MTEMLGSKSKLDHVSKCLEFLNALEAKGMERQWQCICWQAGIVKEYRIKKRKKKANKLFKFKQRNKKSEIYPELKGYGI
jgi:hypothetical protein